VMRVVEEPQSARAAAPMLLLLSKTTNCYKTNV
jgi:hypothetical protein